MQEWKNMDWTLLTETASKAVPASGEVGGGER